MHISTPNKMVWAYSNALRRLIRALDTTASEDELRENVVICIILGVTIVETFLNVLFRVIVSESGFTQYAPQILKDIEKRKSLDYKLRSWPRIVFGNEIDFEEPTVREFMELKELRNRLMHFTSSHETVEVSGVHINGLADTSTFDLLTKIDAVRALEQAEGMVCTLLRLRGIKEDQLPQALHLWTGKVPIY